MPHMNWKPLAPLALVLALLALASAAATMSGAPRDFAPRGAAALTAL
jgi:hypothetical protein